MDEDEGGLSPDSDDEYENSFSKKLKKGGAGGGRKSGGRGSRGGGGRGAQGGIGGSPGGGMGPGGGNSKRRTHADNIPDSEKPFSCEREYFFFTFHSFNLSILQSNLVIRNFLITLKLFLNAKSSYPYDVN